MDIRPIYLTDEQIEQLEYEIVPVSIRIFLTRELRDRIDHHCAQQGINTIASNNDVVNRSRLLVGKSPYVLEPDAWGEYDPAEGVWHDGEMNLVFTRLETVRFVEYLCELVGLKWFSAEEVNDWLCESGLSFKLHQEENQIAVQVDDLAELIEQDDNEGPDSHPNVRVLMERLRRAVRAEDWGEVLHASASIFETLAKDIVAIPGVQENTLASFFDRYRQYSQLPEPVLDWVIATYRRRNTEPLAGHGNTRPPDVTPQEAIALAEMAKAFVRIEYQLRT